MVDWSVGPRTCGVGRKRRVLVVDEELSVVWFLKKIIERETGLYCDGTLDPEDALLAFRAHPYDIVVVDPKMLNFDGIEFLRVLKRLRPEVPVIMITAFFPWSDLGKFMKLGVIDYLIKPFDSRKLIDAIYRGLHMLALREDLRTYRDRDLDPGPIRGALRPRTPY